MKLPSSTLARSTPTVQIGVAERVCIRFMDAAGHVIIRALQLLLEIIGAFHLLIGRH